MMRKDVFLTLETMYAYGQVEFIYIYNKKNDSHRLLKHYAATKKEPIDTAQTLWNPLRVSEVQEE